MFGLVGVIGTDRSVERYHGTFLGDRHSVAQRGTGVRTPSSLLYSNTPLAIPKSHANRHELTADLLTTAFHPVFRERRTPRRGDSLRLLNSPPDSLRSLRSCRTHHIPPRAIPVVPLDPLRPVHPRHDGLHVVPNLRAVDMLIVARGPGHGRDFGHLQGQVEGRVPLGQDGGERGGGGVVLLRSVCLLC